MKLNPYKIKCLMVEHNIGILAFCEQIGCQHRTIKKALSGANVSIGTASKIARGLNVSPEEIIAKEKDSE